MEKRQRDLHDIFFAISFDESASEKYDSLCTECNFLGVDCWIDEDKGWFQLRLQSLPDAAHSIDTGFRIAKATTKALSSGIKRAIVDARRFLQDFPFDPFGASVPL